MSKGERGHPIVRVQERLVYSEPENRWLKLYFDVVKFPDGRRGRYNRAVEGSTGSGVAVLPIDSKRRIGMVRIFRYPIGEWQWELPRGFVELGLTIEQNARKELLEETGFICTKLKRVGAVFPNSGVLSTVISVFLATGLKRSKASPPGLEESISKVHFFTKDEARALVLKGDLQDGITLSALYLAEAGRSD